jgi:hypothetical protein
MKYIFIEKQKVILFLKLMENQRESYCSCSYIDHISLSFCYRETKKYCGILQEAGKDSERIH